MSRRRKTAVPAAPLRELYQRSGVTRMSPQALADAQEVTKNLVDQYTACALEYARHAGHKKLMVRDMQMAINDCNIHP